jgi:hypothetical protein
MHNFLIGFILFLCAIQVPYWFFCIHEIRKAKRKIAETRSSIRESDAKSNYRFPDN